MASFNRIIIMGNLTRDPEHKQLPSGQAVTRLGIASNRQYKNKQTGSMVQEVCFIDVDVYGPQADSCRQYLQKGRPVLVEGRLKFDSWQTSDGQTRSKHSIIADRVVFVQGSQSSEAELPLEGLEAGVSQEFGSAAKTASMRPARAAKPASATTADEFIFKDEQPFQDDLPF